jgi:hypothetical protein
MSIIEIVIIQAVVHTAFMVILCDICGFQNLEHANFCGKCGVDFREPKEDVIEKENPSIKKRSPAKPRKSDSKDEDNLKVIKWCWLKSFDLPHAIVLWSMLANGRSELGFCDCPTCNQGFRELLACGKKENGNRTVTTSSRKIVKEASDIDIPNFSLDLSTIFNQPNETKKGTPGKNAGNDDDKSQKNGKIVIEVDGAFIEHSVLKVLASDTGRKIIRETVK